jgi:hypothetical protein
MTLPRYSSGSAPQQPRFDGALLHDCRATTGCRPFLPVAWAELRGSCWHGLGIQGEEDVGDVTHRLLHPVNVADCAG